MRVFPASAGVILAQAGLMPSFLCFPRIRGGDPVFFMADKNGCAFSPHPRG